MADLPPSEVAYEEAHLSDDRGPLVVGVSGLLMGVVVVIVSLRFIARRTRHMPLLTDDWLALVGMVLIICMCIINIVSVQYGLGKHLLATDPAKGYLILEAAWFLSLDYYLCHWAIKVSVVLSYKRVFTDRTPWVKVTYWLIIGYMTLWAVGSAIVVLAECRPISYFWQQYDISLNPPAEGVCSTNVRLDAIITSALATFIDFVLLILPAVLLSKLHMPLRRKLAISSVFTVGIVACVASIFRLIACFAITSVGSDTTWNTADQYMWTAAEACTVLFCGCVPIVGPLLKTWVDKALGIKPKGSYSSSYGSNARYYRKSSMSTNQLHDRTTELKELKPFDYSDKVIRRTDQIVVRSEEGDSLSQQREAYDFIDSRH